MAILFRLLVGQFELERVSLHVEIIMCCSHVQSRTSDSKDNDVFLDLRIYLACHSGSVSWPYEDTRARMPVAGARAHEIADIAFAFLCRPRVRGYSSAYSQWYRLSLTRRREGIRQNDTHA